MYILFLSINYFFLFGISPSITYLFRHHLALRFHDLWHRDTSVLTYLLTYIINFLSYCMQWFSANVIYYFIRHYTVAKKNKQNTQK